MLLKSFPEEFELEQRLILDEETFDLSFQNINKENEEDRILGYVEVIDSISPIVYNNKKYVGVSIFQSGPYKLGIQLFDYNGSMNVSIDEIVKVLGGELLDLSDKE